MLLQSRDLLRLIKDRANSNIYTLIEQVLTKQSIDLRNTAFKLINLIYEDENFVVSISNFLEKSYHSDKVVMQKLAVDTLVMLVDYILMKTNINTES
jgi:hypothetical protein